MEGWVAKYGKPGFLGMRFASGCFGKLGEKKSVPFVLSLHEHFNSSNIIGHAVIEVKPEGLYVKTYLNENGKVKADELRRYKAFTFYAYKVERENIDNGGILYTKASVREVGLSEWPCEASEVVSYEETVL